MAKPTVWITKGLPGCGKTTWAKLVQGQYFDTVVVCKDDLRAMLNDGRWSKSNEKMVLKIRDDIIVSAVAAGRAVIVADTNLAPKHEEHIRELVGDSADIEIKDFTAVPLEECIKRDLLRPNSVGERVIKRMYTQYIKPNLEPRTVDPELPYAIICDLDGTLALLNGRNPYDASTCEQDLPNKPVAMMLRNALGIHKLIITSGRNDKYRPETERWISFMGFYPDKVLMRKDGDMRQDAIVKEEMYHNEIEGLYNVTAVFDDRQQVVDMWRSLGLTCLQVNEGPD